MSVLIQRSLAVIVCGAAVACGPSDTASDEPQDTGADTVSLDADTDSDMTDADTGGDMMDADAGDDSDDLSDVSDDTDTGGTGPDADTDTEPDVDEPDPLELALATGRIDHIDDASVLHDGITSLLDDHVDARDSAIDALAPDDASGLTWDPTHDSSVLSTLPGISFQVLAANDSANGRDEAWPGTLVAGGSQHGTRFMAFGGNPLRNALRNPDLVNEAMHGFLERSLVWLTEAPLEDLNVVVLSHLDQSHYFPDYNGSVEWLTSHVGDGLALNERQACDGEALVGCVTAEATPDLLIVSQWMEEDTPTGEVAASVTHALALGIPVLYFHWDGSLTALGAELFGVMELGYVRDNYWSKLRITDLDADAMREPEAGDLSSIVRMLRHLNAGDWPFALSDCDDECENTPAYEEAFGDGAAAVRTRLRGYDERGERLWDSERRTFDKLLVLLGDFYRRGATFPMNRATTDTDVFLEAFYADHAQSQLRDVVPVPNDLGNFSRTTFPRGDLG